jgi:hypothetical protein
MARHSGQFQPGLSGNPGGKTKIQAEVERQCRKAGPKVTEVLIELLDHPDPKIRMEAGTRLWDRGFGKPQQPTQHAGQIDHVASLNAAHLAAVRDLSARSATIEYDAEDATVIEDAPAPALSGESRDSAKVAYAERKRGER